MLQSTFQPWRTFQLNRVDSLSLIVFMILTVLCFTYAETPPDLQTQNNDNAAFASFLLISALVLYVGQVVLRCVHRIFCGGEIQNYEQVPDRIKVWFKPCSTGGQNKRLQQRTDEATAAFKVLSSILSSFDEQFLAWFSKEVAQDELDMLCRCAKVLEVELLEFNFLTTGDEQHLKENDTSCLSALLDNRIRRRSQAPEDLVRKKISEKSMKSSSGLKETFGAIEDAKLENHEDKKMLAVENEPSPRDKDLAGIELDKKDENDFEVPMETGTTRAGDTDRTALGAPKSTTPRAAAKQVVPGTPQVVDRLVQNINVPLDKQLAASSHTKKNKNKKSKVHTPTQAESAEDNGAAPQTPKRGATAPRQLLAIPTAGAARTPQGTKVATPRMGEWIQIQDIAFQNNLTFDEPKQPLTE